MATRASARRCSKDASAGAFWAATSSAERNAALGVTEEGDERLHQLVVVICEQEMLAGACLDAFRRKRRGDDGFAGGECLEHLEPHTTAEPDGRNDDCGLITVAGWY